MLIMSGDQRPKNSDLQQKSVSYKHKEFNSLIMDDQNQPDKPTTTTPEANANDGMSSEPAAKMPVAESQAEEITVTTDDKPMDMPMQSPMVTTSDAEPTTSPQPTVSSGPKHGKRGVFVALLLVVVVAGLAAIGYSATRPQKAVQQSKAVVKKDIAVLQVAAFSPLPHTYYPDIDNDNFQSDINMQLFEGLTKFENGSTLKPNLADSWTNPDSSTWVFKLHPGVKFHTGKTMVASDVKASIEQAQPTSIGKVFASTIKTVEVIDPLTVKITTSGPDPLLANELTALSIYDTTSGKANDANNGTGPYTLKSDTPEAIKLAAYDDYHGGHVYTREVDYLGYQQASDVPAASLTGRHIQLLAVQGNADFASTLKTTYGYATTDQADYQVGHLVFNTAKSGTPFANVKIRQAIAQALDKEALIKAANYTGSLIANQTVAQGVPGYNPAIKAPVYSVDAAKSALAAAGYPTGFSFKLTYFPPAQAFAAEVKKQLAVIGVTVTLDPEADQHKLVKTAIGGGTDMYYNVVSSSYVDGSDVLSDFIDSANYTNAAIDKLNTQAGQTLDPAKRVAILQQMGKLVEDDQADIPVYQRQAYVLATDSTIVLSRDTIATTVGTYFWRTYAK